MAQTRATQRSNFDDTVRMRLLEDDADDIEAVLANLQSAFETFKKELGDSFATFKKESDEKIDGLRKVMLGILVSVTTACILLVVNVIILGSK